MNAAERKKDIERVKQMSPRERTRLRRIWLEQNKVKPSPGGREL